MEANNKGTLAIHKEFSASVQSLYQAWTQAEQLRQWWKPLGNQLTEVINEVREGGRIEYKFKSGDQQNLLITGEYKEVIPNEKLVYTWNWQVREKTLKESDYNLLVTFRSTANGSSIEIAQQNMIDQETIHPHEHGWQEALDHLAEYIDSTKTKQGTETTNANPPDGYETQDPAGV